MHDEYQVYEAVFDVIEMNQYASYEQPNFRNALVRRIVPQNFPFPAKIGANLNVIFEYDPKVANTHFKSGVRYYDQGLTEFEAVKEGLSVSASGTKEVGVWRDDTLYAYKWNNLDAIAYTAKTDHPLR